LTHQSEQHSELPLHAVLAHTQWGYPADRASL
jgi:hypothetical protein